MMENPPPIPPPEPTPDTGNAPGTLLQPEVPQLLLRRLWLMLTVVLPLGVLLLLLFNDWLQVHAEMTTRNQRIFWTVMGITAADLVFAAVLWQRRGRRDAGVGLTAAAGMTLLQLAAVSLCIALLPEARPEVEPFILPEWRWLLYLLTFYMPGVFYLLLLIALRLPARLVYASGLLVILPPVMLYAFGTGFSRLNVPWQLVIGLIILLTAGFYLAMLKLLTGVFTVVFRSPRGRLPALIAVAWMLPFGGLALNIRIPFPVDFQDWRVYALTLLNGLVLLLPVWRRRLPNLITVFALGACYPFALYFFLVFLPFLPLSLPAILACGTGFLILAPTLLFLVQNYQIFRHCRRLEEFLPRRKLVAAFVGGLCVMPLYFLLDAAYDRIQIEHAVNACFHSPYQQPMGVQRRLSRSRISATLERLYRAKQGVEVPFLTPLYNQLVFSGLVLSDGKIRRIYFDLNGKEPQTGETGFLFTQATRRHRNPFSTRRSVVAVKDRQSSAAVRLDRLTATPLPTGARLHLTIRSASPANGEYVALLRLPEGVMVNGLTLRIGGKAVPGRIFERKSAFWIYERITTAQRDPALLSYVSPHQLRLLVFPVTAAMPREVTVDLLYPPGLRPEIELDHHRLALPETKFATPYRMMSENELTRLPVVKRRPELVFVLDRSMSLPAEELLALMRKFTAETAAASCRVVSGLIAAGELSPSFPVADLAKAVQWYVAAYEPGTPGFAGQRVFKGAILRYHQLRSEQTYPLFVLISPVRPDRSWNCAAFTALLPETATAVTGTPKGEWQYLDLVTGRTSPALPLRHGKLYPQPNQVRRLPDGRLFAIRDGALAPVAAPGATATTDVYAAALRLQTEAGKLQLDPSREAATLPGLVAASKRTGVLIPQTASIVLETESQWKELEKTEKKKLSRSSAFDVEEVRSDEPSLWWLLPVLFAVGCCAGRRRQQTENRPRRRES